VQPLLDDDPERVGDYLLLGRLGSGAMGSVYLARSPGGRAVAVKMVRPELAEDPEFRARFRREVESARVVGGFWTAAVVDADTEADRPWLATEYVAGPTLHRAVSEHGPLSERVVRMLGAGLAEALHAIHTAGLVHRDLKPGNVLLGAGGPRVIDFGISRAMESAGLTATGMFFGTPGYLSPEQTEGKIVGPPSDVFSLGAVLVFAATGTGPFGDGPTSALLYRVVHAEPDLSRVPDSLIPVIEPCLAKDPARRPTPRQLLRAIGPVEAMPSTPEEWLPQAVTRMIEDCTALIRRQPERKKVRPTLVAESEPVTTAKPPTRVLPNPYPDPGPAPTAVGPTGAPAASTTAPPATAMPPSPPPAASSPAPTPPVTAGPATAGAHPTSSSPENAAPAPRGSEGVRFYSGKSGSLLWTLTTLMLGLLCLAATQSPDLQTRHGSLLVVLILAVYFLYTGMERLVSTVLGELRLTIGPEGVEVRRGRQRRFLAWSQITRIGVAGQGRRRWVVVWLAPGVAPPKRIYGYRFEPYYSGVRLFPVAARRSRRALRRDLNGLQETLRWYAPHLFDPTL